MHPQNFPHEYEPFAIQFQYPYAAHRLEFVLFYPGLCMANELTLYCIQNLMETPRINQVVYSILIIY